ncbi:hypothetical protein ONS95_008991 [Cadophora gregata]|uniref:uncharacterized protein n=1 Tax=Cadophora gregata TaxID=51156 RepID=UPI0026DD9492|nr:uncharacterized protein ONS95_008991 [Cadophora gregata]KAK0124002.1 hypothetical protein ONS95_008991 [Cadophora gregata]KAK0130340.1 hypothetical protein ONS96_000862 [Cadophora gregata f. sp. sojae]
MVKRGVLTISGATICGGILVSSGLPAGSTAFAGRSLFMATETRNVADVTMSAAFATTSGAIGMSLGKIGTAASGLGGALFGGAMTIHSSREHAKSNTVQCINVEINGDVDTVVYYLALCFMKSNGVARPREAEDELEGVVQNLYGRRPQKSKQEYRAVYLYDLVEELTVQFRIVTDVLRSFAYKELEALEWEPNMTITEPESIMMI